MGGCGAARFAVGRESTRKTLFGIMSATATRHCSMASRTSLSARLMSKRFSGVTNDLSWRIGCDGYAAEAVFPDLPEAFL